MFHRVRQVAVPVARGRSCCLR